MSDGCANASKLGSKILVKFTDTQNNFTDFTDMSKF